ncbi:MAG: DUF4173 domain-containing protein [Bacteroidetes bacterium]|nr:DUF4173 domain-containing protein [Bacteroidota bacterium]
MQTSYSVTAKPVLIIRLEPLFIFCFALLFNWFFWEEKFGINLFLYTSLLMAYLCWRNFGSFYHKRVMLTSSITFLTGILVITINSDLAKTIHIFSFIISVGFIQEVKLRSIFYAALSVLLKFMVLPKMLNSLFTRISSEHSSLKRSFYYLRLSLIPVLVLVIYLLIFNTANPLFAHYFDAIYSKFLIVVGELSLLRILFFFIGFLTTAGLMLNGSYNGLVLKDELSKKISLTRKKARLPIIHNNISPFKMRSLLNEYRTALILTGLLNLLLLSVNYIDIKALWFGFEVPVSFNLKEFVHSGTYLLILSIIISMIILLYFFRGNLNFYHKRRGLKILSYIWIVQNIVLCISVFLRNYHYITYHGLAYKRIGVAVFLFLTIIGLITLIIKIKEHKSLYFQLKTNGWALYFVLAFLTFFNWDLIIVKHNLSHPNQKDIDVDFYYQLSDKTLPYLYANLARVEEQIEAHKQNEVYYIKTLQIEAFQKQIDHRKNRYLDELGHYTWFSFNMQDMRAKRLLKPIE